MKKRLFAFMFMMVLTFGLTACGGETTTNDESNGENSQNEASTTSISTPTSAHAGTRTDPYEFGDDIVLYSKSWSDEYVTEYTLHFDEIWGSSKVKNEYPNYSIEDKIIVRGTIEVQCDATDDEISFRLNPVFVTDTLNEEGAQIETYKSGELNNILRSVYSDGTYDIIVLGTDDGIASMSIQYLKISYTDADSQSASIWVVVPEITDSSLTENNSNSGDSVETTETTETDNTSSEPVIPEMTSEELETALLEEPMYVESTKYIVQDERYKSLYPDLLQAVIKNNSGTDIKNAVVAFVAWDSNGFPVKIETKYSFGRGSYVVQCNYSDVNLVDGDTYGDGSGLSLDSDTDNIATFKAIVVSYEDFDGNSWDNPYYNTWVEKYSDKKLN